MKSVECKNHLLRRLPATIARKILDAGELVQLEQRDIIIEPNEPIRYIDFPEVGVISLLQPMDEGTFVEIATIGNEGMVGASVVLGGSTISQTAICTVSGSAWRIRTVPFLSILKNHSELSSLCLRYTVVLLDQVARNFACIRTHTIEERCVRWLLLTYDRCGKEFELTQDFLSYILGISRYSVNMAAGKLAKTNSIRYVHGSRFVRSKITILDKSGLEAATCVCYASMNQYVHQILDH